MKTLGKQQKALHIHWQCKFAGERTATRNTRSSSCEFSINCNLNSYTQAPLCNQKEKLAQEVRMGSDGWPGTERGPCSSYKQLEKCTDHVIWI